MVGALAGNLWGHRRAIEVHKSRPTEQRSTTCPFVRLLAGVTAAEAQGLRIYESDSRIEARTEAGETCQPDRNDLRCCPMPARSAASHSGMEPAEELMKIERA